MRNGNNGGSSQDYTKQGQFKQEFHKVDAQLDQIKTSYNKQKEQNKIFQNQSKERTQPAQHTYTKNTLLSTRGIFKTNGKEYDARSGYHIFPSIKWGEIPNGNYRVSSTSNTNGLLRYNLTPQQDIGVRTHLQIHQKSQETTWDTKGCIAVDKQALENIMIGDKIVVKK